MFTACTASLKIVFHQEPLNNRSEGGSTAETVLENLPLFLHHFGPAGLPLTLELIEQAVDSKVDDVTLKLATKSVRSGTRESLVMFSVQV